MIPLHPSLNINQTERGMMTTLHIISVHVFYKKDIEGMTNPTLPLYYINGKRMATLHPSFYILEAEIDGMLTLHPFSILYKQKEGGLQPSIPLSVYSLSI